MDDLAIQVDPVSSGCSSLVFGQSDADEVCLSLEESEQQRNVRNVLMP